MKCFVAQNHICQVCENCDTENVLKQHSMFEALRTVSVSFIINLKDFKDDEMIDNVWHSIETTITELNLDFLLLSRHCV